MIIGTKQPYTTRSKAYRYLGVAYLGSVAQSTKLLHSLQEKKIATYGIYLASADLSGHNVCPNSVMCKEHCLFGSGRTKMDILSGKNRNVNSRIRKTQLFFFDREYFMQIIIDEIKAHKAAAERDGLEFSVRLNCTSDLNLALFNYGGQNITEIFPDVQFYDYTKVPAYIANLKRFPNYDLTFSYSGANWDECQNALDNNVRVAVVFEKELPKTYRGYTVIDGDKYDARYYDAKNVIVGLKFKATAASVKSKPDTPFVVKRNDIYSVYEG